MNNVDPLGLSWIDWSGFNFLDPVGNFAAGFGDLLTFGRTAWIRDQWNNKVWDGVDSVDLCSDSYTAGKWFGIAFSIASGVAGGYRAAGAAGRGLEFSHWIPARMGGARSLWNGNYVSQATHALSDPYRYRFMPRVWKAVNPMPGRLSQQWTRLPKWIKGAGLGTGYAVGSSVTNN